MERDNKYNNLFLMLLLFIFVQTITYANQLDVIHINKNTTKVNLFDSIEIFEDKSDRLTIHDVSKEKYTYAFKPASVIGNSFGITKSSFWVRFSIKADEDVVDSLYLELAFPLVDNVVLYTQDKDGKFQEKKSGESIASSFKDVDYRNPLFHIIKDKNLQTFYMQVKSESSTQIPLYIYTSAALLESIDTMNFIFGGYYGIMLLLMVIALLAFIKIRDMMFLTYSIYLLSYLFFQLSINGFFVQYFLILPLEYANYTTVLSLGSVVITGPLFAGSFLKLWDGRHPKVRFLLLTLMVAAIVGSLISFTISYTVGSKILTIAGVVLPPTVLFAAIYSLYEGYQPAKYFLVAWGIFLLGVFVTGLVFLGLLPHTFFTAYAMQIGSTFELLLLGYALIDRVNSLYKEKEEANQKSESYLNQINVGLESLVSQRTKELQEKNVLLRELSHRDGMTGMLNHNTSIEQLKKMKSTASRHGYKLAVLMIDIDLFKGINDKYGHISGDQVIIKIAEVIHNNIRPSDFAGRYGGEEFIVLLHETEITDATKLAERMRMDIKSLKIPEIKNESVSASFGVSTFDVSNPDADIILQADKALYKAKQSGRNQVCVY